MGNVTEPGRKAFADLVTAVLRELNWTQAKLAREMGTSPGTLSGCVSGQRALTVDTAQKLAEVVAREAGDVPRRAWWTRQADWIANQGGDGQGTTLDLAGTAETHVRSDDGVFIGREEAQSVFLAISNDRQERPQLLVVIGDGGHGKTKLSARLEEAARHAGDLVVSAAIQAESNQLDVLAQWASGQPHSSMPAYAGALARYRTDLREVAQRRSDPDQRIPLISGAFGDGRQLLDNSGWFAPEQRLLEVSLSEVSEAFLSDLSEVAKLHRRVVFVLDDYHRASSDLDQWLRDLLLRSDLLPADSRFLLASRTRLTSRSQQWSHFQEVTTEVWVKPFTSKETCDYLTSVVGPPSPATMRNVTSVTRGVPMLVARAATILAGNPSAGRKEMEQGIRGLLVPRAISHLPDVESVSAVLNCASILRTFDIDFLEAVLGREVGTDVAQIESETSFFEPVSGGWQMHEAMADQVRRDFRTSSPSRFAEICSKATATLADQAAESAADPIASSQLLIRRVALTSLYDLDAAMRLLAEEANYFRGVSVGVGNPIARLLHAVALSAPEVAEHPEFIALSGVIGLASGDIGGAYEALERVVRESDPRFSRRTEIVVLSALVDACHRRGNVRDAVRWCQDGAQAAAAEGDSVASALFQVRLAETYGILGDESGSIDALASAETLLDHLGQNALAAEGWIVAGYVYAERGDSARAITAANKAVATSPPQHQGVIGALRNNIVAWAHTMDGDVEAGIPSADRAMDFFSNELEDAYHLAVVSLTLGELHLAAGEYDDALTALALAKRCFEDIDGRAFRLCVLADTTTALIAERRFKQAEAMIKKVLDDPSTPRDDAYNYGRVLLNQAIATHDGQANRPTFRTEAQAAVSLLDGYERGRQMAAHWLHLSNGDGSGLQELAAACGASGYWDLAAESYAALVTMADEGSSDRADFVLKSLEAALTFNVFLASRTFEVLRADHNNEWPKVLQYARSDDGRLGQLVSAWSKQALRPRAQDRGIKLLNNQLELE